MYKIIVVFYYGVKCNSRLFDEELEVKCQFWFGKSTVSMSQNLVFSEINGRIFYTTL